MKLVSLSVAISIAAASAACDPYERSGQYYAGPVDARDFPRAYRGAGATATAFGTLAPSSAFVDGQAIGYFAFPVPKGASPTVLGSGSKAPPLAYVFDPGDTSPFPKPSKCAAPTGYSYDVQRDFVHFDEQGSILTALPTRTVDPNTGAERFTYAPIVAEVPVASKGEPCQDSKSADDVVARKDVTVMVKPGAAGAPATGVPSGRYLAWAVIDPVADVYYLGGVQDPKTYLGPQKWGWFNHYLLAYIDGGYIPTETVTIPGQMGEPDRQETHAREQTLYVPDVVIDPDTGMAVPNEGPGSGFDILELIRPAPGYSPICHVKIFTQADPENPIQSAAAAAATTVTDTMTYVYCLQPEAQAP